MAIDVYKKVQRIKEHISQLTVDLNYYNKILAARVEKLPTEELIKSRLTKQQRVICSEIMLNKSNQQVADSLGLSLKTVKYHLTRIYALLECEGKEELIALLNGRSEYDIKLQNGHIVKELTPGSTTAIVRGYQDGPQTGSVGISLPLGTVR